MVFHHFCIAVHECSEAFFDYDTFSHDAEGNWNKPGTAVYSVLLSQHNTNTARVTAESKSNYSFFAIFIS